MKAPKRMTKAMRRTSGAMQSDDGVSVIMAFCDTWDCS